MKSGRLALITILLSVLFSACDKDSKTIVSIIVKNKAGVVQPNIVVYEMEKPQNEVYGNNPVYANALKVTNSDGIAIFTLNDYEYDNAKQGNILYYTVFNETSGSTYTVAGSVAVAFSEGDSVSEELIIN